MASGGADVLLIGGLLVFVGVLASVIFERTRIPDVVLLVLVGILAGPVFGLLDATSIGGVASVFTTLALVVILFEGGLDLNVRLLERRLALTTALLGASYFTTAAVVAVVAHFTAGFTWPISALFGLVMAPLSSSILIPLVGKLKILPETRALLIVESALGDVLAVLATFTLANAIAAGAFDGEAVLRSLGASFLIGGALALVAGVVWLFVLSAIRKRPYAYLVTFALALILFGAVDAIGGNGVVAVLVFSLVLGNAKIFAKRLPSIKPYEIDTRIRWFHAEMSFFVRTFFFIYLGLIVTLGDIGPKYFFTVALVGVAILAVRAATVWALVKRRPVERQDVGYLSFLIARGLATAALAGAPLVVSIAAGTGFTELAFGVLLLTNLVMTGFILVKESGFGDGADPEAALVDFEELRFDMEGLQEIAPVGDEPAT